MSETTSKIESLSDFSESTDGDYLRWQAEIQAAEKELDKWQRKGRRIVKEFRADRMETSGADPNFERKFNLFAANVGILGTALLNQNPEPTVDREFRDTKDDIGRVACLILERAVAAHNARNFKTVSILKQAVQDMLVPGIGSTWHTYHADIETKTYEPTPEELEINPQAEALEYDEVVSEQLVDDYVYWEDLIWSPARCYDEVRWFGRKTYLTRDKLIKRFGKKIGKAVALDYDTKKTASNVETKNQVFQQAVVYEIWDKESEKVIWWTKGYEKLLDKKDDFLELDDFFPCPRPLIANLSNGKFMPIPDYEYARDQYRELNEINTRISLLVRACRVAGVYDKASAAIPNVLNNAAENVLVPVDSWAAFAEKGGIKGAIDWIPLDQVVITIDQLTKNREDVKQQIYEITGMADIIRGASKASETLGAQKIKAQYASMRIQDRQKSVVQYCSSVFDIQVQLMRKHMGVETIAKLAQVESMSEPPQLIQMAMQAIKMPDFVLKSRVESDTLSDIDFQAEKQDRMEYMMTITNYLKETMGAIQNDPLMGPFLLQLLQFSLAGFKVGKKFEGELNRTFQQITKQLSQPKPPQPTPEQQKAQAEIQVMQQEAQLDAQGKQQELGFKQQELQLKLVGKQQEMAMKAKELQQKQALSQQEHAMKAAQSQEQFHQEMVMNRQRAQEEAVNTVIKGSPNGQA